MLSLCSRALAAAATASSFFNCGPKEMSASVLLVDDDPQIVRAIVPALEVSGLAVTIATNGADALQHVDCGRWDALIVDLGLPDIDGKSVVRHSRSRSTAPVIVISAQHSAEEVESARAAGACCFLHKPFRTPELVQRVEESIAAEKSRVGRMSQSGPAARS